LKKRASIVYSDQNLLLPLLFPHLLIAAALDYQVKPLLSNNKK